MYLYPNGQDAIPEVQRLVSMLTGGTPKDVRRAVKSAHVVSGYVASLVLGDPDAPTEADALTVEAETFQVLSIHEEPMSDYMALQTLKALAAPAELPGDGEVQARGLLDTLGGKAALKLLLPVLQRWLVRWLEQGGLEDIINRIGVASEA